ncbi:MAG: cupredoxin domain-containing protein [Gaiellaceae bacterium]
MPLALLLAACGGGNGDGAGASSADNQTIRISEKEYTLNPSTITLARAGTYSFEITNDGQVTHALNLEASGGGGEVEAGEIAPGESKTVEFTVKAGESYELYCPIDGHRQQGMDGTIVLAGAPTGTTTNPQAETTTSEDDGDDDNGGRDGY